MTDPKIFDELAGNRIGDYVVDAFVGAGGQAVVFRAHSQLMAGTYALKVFGLLDSVRAGLDEGLKEANKQSLVDHASVVKVFTPGIDEVDFRGEARRVLYLPMSYAEQGSCEKEPPFAGRQLSESDFKAMINLLDGLAAIHEVGLTHNDIKPANILKVHDRLDAEDREFLKITDFGIARVLRAIGVPGDNVSGVTPPFMSPEQLDHMYSKQGDIYSMGATLYYLVTGENPITIAADDSNPLANLLAWQRAHQAYPRPDAHRANAFCPPRLALLIMRMMSVEPDARPSITTCVDELRTLIQLLIGRFGGFRVPPALSKTLDAEVFPLHYHTEFTGIFKPEVHSACGLTLFVLRLRMRHPVLKQYKRLIRCVSQQFADNFSMYETWGSYDINMFIWSDHGEIERLSRNLADQFLDSHPQVAIASTVDHFHDTDRTPMESPSPVLALAVQENVEIPGFVHASYVCSAYPADMPERSIRAFTYVEAAEDVNRFLFRKAIAEHTRSALRDLWRERPSDFRRLSIIELAADTGSREFASTAVIVDYVATEYKCLSQVPTTIIETLGENAVRTVTCLESRRIVIQSDRILL